MKENTPELIIERAKFLHVDMVATQIKIRKQLMERFLREFKEDKAFLQSYILSQLTYIYFERTGIALPIN